MKPDTATQGCVTPTNWPLLVVCCLQIFTALGATYGMGSLFADLMDVFQASYSVTSLVPALSIGFTCVSAVVVGPFVHRFGPRKAALLGCSLTTVGCLVAFFATDIVVVIVCLGVLLGIGVSFAEISASIVLGVRFDHIRSVAVTVGVTAGAASSAVYPVLLRYLVHTYALRGCFLIMAAINLQLFVTSMLIGLFSSWPKKRRQAETEMTFEPKRSRLNQRNWAGNKDAEDSSEMEYDSRDVTVSGERKSAGHPMNSSVILEKGMIENDTIENNIISENIETERKYEKYDGQDIHHRIENGDGIPETGRDTECNLGTDENVPQLENHSRRQGEQCIGTRQHGVEVKENNSDITDRVSVSMEQTSEACIHNDYDEEHSLKLQENLIDATDNSQCFKQYDSACQNNRVHKNASHCLESKQNHCNTLSCSDVLPGMQASQQSRLRHDGVTDKGQDVSDGFLGARSLEDESIEGSADALDRDSAPKKVLKVDDAFLMEEEGKTEIQKLLPEEPGNKISAKTQNKKDHEKSSTSELSTDDADRPAPGLTTRPSTPSQPGLCSRTVSCLQLEVFHNVRYVAFALSMTVYFSAVGPSLFLTDMARDGGFSVDDGSLFLSIVFAGNMVGRVMSGVVGHALGGQVFVSASLCHVAVGLTCLCYTAVSSYSSYMLLSFVHGLGLGLLIGHLPLTILQALGPARYATGLGYTVFLMGIAYSCGGPFGGMIRAQTGSYNAYLYLSGAQGTLTCGLLLLVALRSRPQRQ